MADSRLLVACVKCGKANVICKLGFDGEAWMNPSEATYANIYARLLAFLTEHLLKTDCRREERNGVEAARHILRLAIEDECFYSLELGWILIEHLDRYGIKRDS